jgi:hypothetical protein
MFWILKILSSQTASNILASTLTFFDFKNTFLILSILVKYFYRSLNVIYRFLTRTYINFVIWIL